MTRSEFRARFGSRGPVVLPVIHVLETARTLDNIDAAVAEGAPGCFLINHDFGVPPFLEILKEVRAARPALWLGVNFLAVTGREAFPVLADLARQRCQIDAYWADDACIDEHQAAQAAAQEIAAARAGWSGLYFGGTAFKKQRAVDPAHYATAARTARDWMDVVTTSGAATGIAAESDKIAVFREAVGAAPLALASGITPENAHEYSAVDCFMVATGINYPDNFYDIEPARLRRLLEVCETLGETV